jgi:hypothetical protein
MAAQAGGMEATVLESCHSTWIFDAEHMRFRRILKDVRVAFRCVTTEWRPYSKLQFDPLAQTFTVVLNDQGSRMIRCCRHTHNCTHCGKQATSELSLHDISLALSA